MQTSALALLLFVATFCGDDDKGKPAFSTSDLSATEKYLNEKLAAYKAGDPGKQAAILEELKSHVGKEVKWPVKSLGANDWSVSIECPKWLTRSGTGQTDFSKKISYLPFQGNWADLKKGDSVVLSGRILKVSIEREQFRVIVHAPIAQHQAKKP